MTATAEFLKKVPIGFRFHPTEVELVSYYLQNKIQGVNSHANLIIADIEILRHEPWDLPAKSLIKSDDDEWFFFSGPEYMPTKRNQIKRSTNEGFWKITGREHSIKGRGGGVVGKKRILTFYIGRNRSSQKTDWVIHEYYIPLNDPTAKQRDIVLCRLIKKLDKKTGAATCDEGGPSNNASDVENADEWVDSVLVYQDQEFNDELTHNAHCNDSTGSRPLRVVCADGVCSDTDSDALPAQVKFGSGPSSTRYRDVMLHDRAHKQGDILLQAEGLAHGGFFSEEGHSDFDNLFPADSSDSEATPTFQIDITDMAFGQYYTNERGRRARYPLGSPRDAVKLREKPLPAPVTPEYKPAPEKPCPVLAFDEYYTNERGRRAGYPPSSSRGAVKLPEKPKEPERPKPRAVNLPKESITKVNKDKKVTQGEGSSFISWETIPLTSPPSVYLFNAVLGTILFIIFARELVLYGNWC